MALDPALLEILRCPDEHHAVLEYDEPGQTLTCTECRRVFEIRDNIPVLLLDEARSPESVSEPPAEPASEAPADSARPAAEGSAEPAPEQPAPEQPAPKVSESGGQA